MKLGIVIIALLSLIACDKIHNMMDMPNKMDAMNNKMDGLTKGMNDTNGNMGQMITLMGKTVDGVDKQKVLLPFEKLMDESNYDMLSPIPSQLMPFAKEFAAAIPTKDLAELAYLWLKEIREVNPIKASDKDGNEIEYTNAEIAQINKVKLGRLIALQAVCGFLSDEKTNELIELHIKKYSRFEKTAYKILMMRTQFVRDILLKESLLSEPLSTVGEIKEAMMYVGQLDFIARLPFKNKIAYKVDGFLAPMDPSIEEKLDPKMMITLLKKIDLSVKQDFKLEQQDTMVGYSQEENSKIQNEKAADFAKAMEQLNTGLQFWEANTPK